jgi:UDP-3-O-[3-hydroxymyristoyl] glucosamine N-acyltransferase
MQIALSTLCERIHGELIGDGSILITGISDPEHAQAGHLTLADDERRLAQVLASPAAAILVSNAVASLNEKAGIKVADPKLVFAHLLGFFYPEPSPDAGVHPSAVIASGVHLGEGVSIGAHAVIEKGASIGRGSVIGAGAYIGREVTIGEGCTLHPNVVIYYKTHIADRVIIHSGSVIGGDGFGYVFHQGAYHKIPQVGNVIIESDVEIGCNACVDRSTLGSTVIGRGTKIDNLVQVAHNNRIGRHVALAGQVGLAGSVTVGDYTRLGGKVGVTDHLTIGPGVQAGAGTLVIKSIPAGESIWGVPARPAEKTKNQMAMLARLPQLVKRWLGIEAQVDDQGKRLAALEQRVQNLLQGQ